MNIWQFQKMLSRHLQQWAGTSIFLGVLLNLQPNKTIRGIGVQFVGWGLINGAIAYVGQRATQKRQEQANAATLITQTREKRNLRRLLWINSGLDLVYMAGGWWLSITKGRESDHWQGQGFGIILQGAFLFVFDLIHALQIPGSKVISSLSQTEKKKM